LKASFKIYDRGDVLIMVKLLICFDAGLLTEQDGCETPDARVIAEGIEILIFPFSGILFSGVILNS